MDVRAHASRHPDSIVQQAESAVLEAAAFALPSPATDDVLETPTLNTTLGRHSLLSPWLSHSGIASYADPLPAVPDLVRPPQLSSPPCEQTSFTDMDTIVGGALAPVHTGSFALPSSEALKYRPGLQLPSFDLLGIASPHPDHYGQGTFDGADVASRKDSRVAGDAEVGMYPHVSDALSDSSLEGNAKDVVPLRSPAIERSKMISNPLHCCVDVLTPPAEASPLVWEALATGGTPAIQSSSTDPAVAAATLQISEAQTQQHPAGHWSTIDVNPSTPGEDRPWIHGAIQAMLENLRPMRESSTSIRVLSHALPCPSEAGHIFPTIINSILDVTPTSPTVWINVVHAVPGRYNIADLPTSPPSTPGPSIGGEDYFTQKVFDSAVQVTDYQEDLAGLPKSPRPVVSPSSIDVSVVERYIPPTSAREFANMFEERGPSILIDRMVELSPKNGTLIFIYPTKAGAQTFMHEYLSPVLDPLLRAMVVVNGLSHDLGSSIGNMEAVNLIPSHETLKRRINLLCAQLTQRSHYLERFHGRKAAFNVMYSEKKEVYLDREVWAKDWWTRQEKSKIRTNVTKYANEAMAKKQNVYATQDRTSTHLIQELFDGVTSRPYQGEGPTKGVEVSVFVIRRSG